MMSSDKHYSVKGWRGIAFYFAGYPKTWEPCEVYCTDPETGEEYTEPDPCGEGEWVEDQDSGKVLMVMVGDDCEHEVEESDCHEIPEESFCRECGQVGCCHGNL